MLAAVAYLLVPGLYAAHVAVAHADHSAVVSDLEATGGSPERGGNGHEHHEQGEREHERDGHDSDDPETPCTLCQLIGTLGHAAPVPAPTALVALDVTSPEYVFTPVEPRLSADPAATPASPRAPPALA